MARMICSLGRDGHASRNASNGWLDPAYMALRLTAFDAA
jgi:hypothetical protein